MNLRDAVANLIKVKGRHNTEVAYQKLIEAFDAPKKEWVGLTPADRIACERLAKGNYVALWAAIEAKLKDKNETT